MRRERDTALFMLREMRGWGFTVNSKTYEHLLQLVSSHDHLKVYLPVSAKKLIGKEVKN